MSSIAALGPLLPLESRTPAGAAAFAKQSAGAADNPSPAVIVSVSSAAATALTQSLLTPAKIDDALSGAVGANGFAANYTHGDWAGEAAEFGEAVASRNKAEALNAAVYGASSALSTASSLGIPIQDSVGPEALKNGAAPGRITVGAFTFASGGSTYAVTPGKNGTLVGTKDGQSWKTWQLNDPTSDTAASSGASVALQTLTALNAKHPPTDKLDVSA